MTTPAIRAALERLVETGERVAQTDPIGAWWWLNDAIAAARAALAEPVGEVGRASVEQVAQIVYENAMLATAPDHAKPHWPSWADLPNSDVRIHALNTADTILARWGRPATPPALPPNYVDPEHQGDDRKLLQAFYQACKAEGGTGDEIYLRGIRAVLAARREV
jgi:hypothetical protein